jgi:hypothetical protein
MSKKEIIIKELYEWIADNHSMLQEIYINMPEEHKKIFPFTLYCISSYCDYAKI